MLVADEPDLADLDFRALFDHKGNSNSGGRNRPNFGSYDRELPAVFGKQFLDRHLGFLDLGGIVLAFYSQADLALLEPVEHVAGRDRTQAGVVDLTYRGTLFDVDVNDPALGGLFTLHADIFEVICVPKGVEVAEQGSLVVDIAGFGEDARFDGLSRDAAVSMHPDVGNNIFLTPSGKNERPQQEQGDEDACHLNDRKWAENRAE